ncbi:protein IQ-DOMAIN 14-like [Triticum dicoccoides]|uniref:protein IQ-DOMAIN 14-like n=1 Tax=Triticum dicoccoides TaxID=85692 RepID=UPI00188F692E|nr:protein IQ-DOMAIN 14-like [Triticum dicoccoides]
MVAMGKAGRWLRSILAGKRDSGRRGGKRGQSQCDSAPLAELPAAASPREKRRWSFRRPAAAVKPAAALSPLAQEAGGLSVSVSERELEQSKHAVAVTMAAADAAVIYLTAPEAEDDLNLYATPVQEAAAARIQATFRGYLARKALCALRGLVKLQALIRGHLVRKQARATLRRMQALLMAQTRVRAQRMRMLEEEDHAAAAAPVDRRSPQHPRRRRSYEMDRSGEEHAKIVEMDMGEPPRRGRSSCSVAASEPWSAERRRAEYYGPGQCSPAPSAAFTEITSPRAYSGHFEDFEPATARVSAYVPAGYADEGESASEFFPNYMANTQSSRAKARSQSAPKQRPDSPSPLERQPSRRRGGPAPLPRSVKMQRSSSHVGVPMPSSAAAMYAQHYPWSVKLDRSSASLHESECGSTSSVLTAATTVGYSRSMVGFEVHRSQY